MPQYVVNVPGSGSYRVNSPEDLTDNQVWSLVQGQIGATQQPQTDVSQMSTKQLEEAPSASTSLGDIGRSLGSGVIGGVKTVADVFGAGNDVSNYLGRKAQEIQGNITPERKAEIARRQELEKRASESGDLWEEAKAYLGGIAEAPIQSVAQAVGTSVPSLAAGLASVFVAPESAIGIGVVRLGQIALGAAQGVGEYKGDVHDAVKQAYIDKGYKTEEAENLAVKAQEYSMDKALEVGGAGLLGALDAFTGVESSVRKAVEKTGKGKLTKEAIEAGIKELPEKAVSAPSLGVAALKSAAGEAPVEGLQGGFGQYAQNLALQREGLQEGEPTQGVFGAALRDAAVGALTGGAFAPVKFSEMKSDYNLDQTLRQAKEDKEFEAERQAAIERSAGLPRQPEVFELPEGYRVTAQDVGTTEEPAEHHIMEQGGQAPLTTVGTLEEVTPKMERLKTIRQEEAQKTLDQIDKINESVQKQTKALETMEATGQANTPQYAALKEQTEAAQDAASQQVADLMEKNEALTKDLVHVPGAPQQKVQQQFVLSKDGQSLGVFDSLQEAESTVKKVVGPESFKQAEENKQQAALKQEQIESIRSNLEPMMAKFGLKDVGLKLVDQLKMGAEGSYANSLISIALNHDKPIQTMRHESIHALKDLGFFTPQQWSVLENMAKKKWIAEHLENNYTEVNGNKVTRFEGYKQMGLTDSQIAEEAIADAFANFDKNKPPPGMLAALHNKLVKFFEALKNGFTGAGFQTSEDVFGKIERGELKGTENAVRPTEPTGRPSPRGDEGKFSLGEGNRGPRAEARSIAPLEGAPTVEGATGPDANLVSVAEKYAKDNGSKLNRQAKYAQVNEGFGKRLAQAYEEMPHAPNDPKVKEAYADLLDQTRKQYDALTNAGYKFNFFDSQTDPYNGNPWNAMRDLRNNKTMSVYGTYDGFGTEGVTDADVKDNPLLQNTGLKWKDQKGVEHDVTGNDLFRAVHDAFGHGLEGGGFRHHGEENAWQAHSRLYKGPALAALTSETRGQNSWLNFGPYGEKNQTAKVEDTVFAPQKTGLMPEWAYKENIVLNEPDFIREPGVKGITLGTKQPNASTFIGVHYGKSRVDTLNGDKYGTGIRGAERRRLDDAFDERIKNRVYFYVPKPDGTMPLAEAGLGGFVYKQKFDNILAPGPEMSKLFSEARGDSNNFETAVIDAGYDGYAVPSMSMMVIMNHNVPVDYLGTKGELAEQGIKYSLAGAGVERSTRDLMERSSESSRAELGLKNQKVKGATGMNNVRDVAKALNQHTLDQFGRIGKGEMTAYDIDDLAKAVTDEVGYQLRATAKTGTGQGWYSKNYPNALKKLGDRFPELKENRHARSVFSALVAVTSNGEDVSTNIKNAIRLYSDLRQGKPLVPIGVRRGDALTNNLVQIQNLLDKHKENFAKELTQEITVADMNAYLRSIGEKPDASYLANTRIPAAAIYFGPKLGAFFANLSGSEGYLTMDLWWTRSINRMRGLLMPQATESSINNFRDLVGRPSATREEVIAAAVPFKQKYEDHNYVTELEFLAKGKEPNKDKYPQWLAKAKRNAGPAFQQLMLEHRLEKMANTIYKNEYEMLQEAPFNASDRKFMYEVARKAQRNLSAEGIDLSLADIQAALWYYEKRLYAKLTGREADDIGYEEAIIKQSSEGHGREGPSVVFSEQPNGRNEPTREGRISDETGGVTPEKLSLKRVSFPTAREAREAAEKAGVPDTPEFNKFARATQFVDKNGKPRVMYHGTSREFYEFLPAGQSEAIFISDSAEEAEGFGSEDEDRMRRMIYKALSKDEKIEMFKRVADQAAKDGEITQALADGIVSRVKKKIPEYGDFFGDIEQRMYDELISLSPAKANVMPVFVSGVNIFDYENPYHVEGVMERLKDNVKFEQRAKESEFTEGAPRAYPDHWLAGTKGRIVRGLWQAIEDKRVQQAIRDSGFDGFSVKEINGGRKNYAVYSPSQIKSATGNIGEFSRENKDIRLSLPTISAGAEDRVNKVTTVREEKGFLSRIFNTLQPENYSSYRQGFLNRYNELSVADKVAAERMGGVQLMAEQSAEHAALMSDMHAGVTASAFGVGGRRGGVPVIKNGLTTIDHDKKGLLEVLMPLAKYNDPKAYRYFQFYSAVKRGARLYAEGRERLIEPGDITFANELAQKFPEFESIRKDWVEYNNNLIAYQKAAGVLSERDAIEYTKHYDYIPFFRQLDGKKTIGPNIYQSISGVKKPKKLEGGEAPLADFLETVVRNSQSAIAAGMKNLAAQRARDVGKQAGIVHDIPLGSSVSDFEKIKVLENGILKEYQSDDPLFIDAVKSLHMPEIPFMGLLSMPSNFLREAVTRDPGFILANLMRDSLSAYAISGQNITPITDTIKNFGKAFARKSPGFEAMMDYGIIGGYEFSENVEQSGRTVAKELSKRAGNKPPVGLRTVTALWDGLEHATTASDAATRIAIYDRVLKETGNEAEAIRAAWEIMNFNRKGNSPLVRVLTAAVPFLNARVQGLDVFYRAATGKMNTQDAKLIQRRFIARASMMMALSFMYAFAVSGDPDYEKQEEETKDNYWILPSLGLKIPIPFEVGTLFKTIPERIVRATFGTDTGQDFKNAMIRATLTTLPINPVGYVPQVFKPMIEVLTNYNMFTGKEIIGQGMKDIAPEYQIGPSTSSTAEFIGKTLGLSPMKVDHMIKGYTGTMGMYGIDLIDSIMSLNGDSPKPNKRFEQMAIIKRFAMDPEARGSITAYYNLKDDVNTVVRTANLLEKSMKPDEYAKYLQENMGLLAFKDYVNDLEKSMKEFRDMRKMVLSSTMSGKEKQEALTAIGQGEQNLTSNIPTVKKLISSMK